MGSFKIIDSEQREVNEFTTNLDIAKFGAEVHSSIKDNISADFILSKLSEKDKTFIIEMIGNAYYMRSILDRVKLKVSRKHFDTNPMYQNFTYEEYISAIQHFNDRLFDMFMAKIYMVAILNRNVDKNTLLEMLFGFTSKPENEEIEDVGGFGERIKSLLKKGDGNV